MDGIKFPVGDECIVIGYRKFKSKNGVNCCIVGFVTAFNDRDLRFGAKGYKYQEQFVPDSYHDLFNADVIGKNIRVNYEINGERAYVKSIDIL